MIASAIAQITGNRKDDPTVQAYLKRAVANLQDAKVQWRAGNYSKNEEYLDNEETGLQKDISEVGNAFRLFILATEGEEEDDELPEWAAEQTAMESVPRAIAKPDPKAEWNAEVDRAYHAASKATNGFLVNSRWLKENIDPRSLFKGPKARAMKYASDELKDWWLENPRTPSYNEWAKASKETRETGGDPKAA